MAFKANGNTKSKVVCALWGFCQTLICRNTTKTPTGSMRRLVMVGFGGLGKLKIQLVSNHYLLRFLFFSGHIICTIMSCARLNEFIRAGYDTLLG